MTNKLPVVGKRYRSKLSFEIKAIEGDNLIVTGIYGEQRFPIVELDQWEELPKDEAETELERINKAWGDGYQAALEDCRLQKNLETRPETQSYISELSPEVKEAMEELKREIALCGGGFNPNPQTELERKGREIFYYFLGKSQNLLNALDKQFANNKIQAEEVVDNKIKAENGNFKHLDNAEKISQDIMKEESIWKPVSELPTPHMQKVIIVEDKNGDRFRCTYSDDLSGGKDVNHFILIGFGSFVFNYRREYQDRAFLKKENIVKWSYETDFINDYEKLKERVKKLEGKS